ncbi:MAG: PC4/YdbC family ssDNA-binding protein [Clostridia bacterium]|nr:PC4/YdbC family ssDNA-binding protein [Clostridia bacterium]
MADFKFEVIEKLGCFSDENGGWKKELNIVRWYDNTATYDLRAWNEDHTRMGKGIALSKFELRKLREILVRLEL